jgi:hypothetical protein
MTSHSVTPNEPKRDPEDRRTDIGNVRATREKMFDKTLADSFPASDPPSTLPDPTADSFSLSSVE